MTNLEELMKCPECLLEGHFEILIDKKRIVVECQNCSHRVSDRIPYPKHRTDHEGYQYKFRVGDVRPISTHSDDDVTCSQKEYEQDN